MKNIIIGSDHAGYTRKQELIHWLQKQGYTVTDVGTHSEASVDYPDFVHPLAKHILLHPEDPGILICGSGEGVCMTANKYAHIRAALVWNPEVASLSREHNNANVLCLPARFITEEEAIKITETFLNAGFEGGRHQGRIDKMNIR